MPPDLGHARAAASRFFFSAFIIFEPMSPSARIWLRDDIPEAQRREAGEADEGGGQRRCAAGAEVVNTEEKGE